MDPILRRVVELANPWLGDPDALVRHARARLPASFVDREAARPLALALSEHRKAHLVIGPRQAGKSTLVWSVLGRAPRHALYVNCEEPLVRSWCRSPTLFGADVKEWLPAGGTLFLEEAQWLEEAGLLLKGLIDAHLGRPIVATGSASFHLLSRTRESLAGRATRHRLWPLSLVEAAATRADALPAVVRAARRRALERQLVFGGYPEAWTHTDPARVLDELAAAFVLRDASDRFRVARPDAFRTVLRLMAGQVGDLVNLSEWGRIVGVATSTVGDYVALLEETHIVRRVRPFIGGKRAELTKAPKVYFVDNGLRNALTGGFEGLDRRADTGKLLENWVFTELHKAFPQPGGVRYWRTRSGAELDFVLEPSPGRLVAIEVKAGAVTRPTIPRSARSFIAAYRPERCVFVHRGEAHAMSLDGVPIEWRPAEALPELLDQLVW